jgi:Bacterial capsule synthesis protein PGA_cap
MGRDRSPARRQLSRGHFGENCAPHRWRDARIQPLVRCDRGVDHWGGNWGYRTRDEETRFAHQLIEHGIAVVHGHSSHHVKSAEIHSDRLVLYGCGDLLNDYEGISGYVDGACGSTLHQQDPSGTVRGGVSERPEA